MSNLSTLLSSPYDPTALQIVKIGIGLSQEIGGSAIGDAADAVLGVGEEEEVNKVVADALTGEDMVEDPVSFFAETDATNLTTIVDLTV